MQYIMGGLTAWLLAVTLMRFLQVRPWMAIVAAVVFAIDPVQVLYEHMVLTETTALLVSATFLVTALEYLRRPALHWLILVPFLGTLLVGLRMVYLPVVLATTALLPVGAYWPSFAGRTRVLALALLVSCSSTALCHIEYRRLTGRLAWREPAYHYWTGFFLMAAVSPLLRPEDSSDPRVSEAVAVQSKSGVPLNRRADQLWHPEGLVSRLRTVFDGDEGKADQAALHLGRSALWRNPAGYVSIAIRSYLHYWRTIPSLPAGLEADNGNNPGSVNVSDSQVFLQAFGEDVSNQDRPRTLARSYHILAAPWYVVLLATPLITAAALVLSPANPKGVALLLVWECLLTGATCFGTTEEYRLLHPFSFTALAAIAILAEQLTSRRCRYSTDAQGKCW